MMAAFRCPTAVFAVVVLVSVCFSSNVFAFSIIIRNETGVTLRIDSLEDNCGTALIKEINPVRLAHGEWIKFEGVVPTIHLYKMCANGTCESSALGMDNSEIEYIMIAKLDDRCICVTQIPLLWPGVIECTKPKYEL